MSQRRTQCIYAGGVKMILLKGIGQAALWLIMLIIGSMMFIIGFKDLLESMK